MTAFQLAVTNGSRASTHGAGMALGRSPAPATRDPSATTLARTIQDALAGHYTIEHPIGRGGTATVFLAREEHPPRQVAIKVLDPALSDR